MLPFLMWLAIAIAIVVWACAAAAPPADAQSDPPPGKVNEPIVSVRKELYKKHPASGESACVSVQYVGPNLEQREVHSMQRQPDVSENIRARWSTDNGRTWSEFVPIQLSTTVDYGGVSVRGECEGISTYDPTSSMLMQVWLRQINVGGEYHAGGAYHNFTYYRLSGDHGRTWSDPKQLCYEDGDPFDPDEPLKPTFLNHNEGYFGNNILIRSDGTLVHCLAHANAPGDPKNNERPWRMGSVLFTAKWDAEAQDYDWTPGARVEISPEWSARGLSEPEVAELEDGRLLVVWRGSTHGWDGTVAKLPGRKFYSMSTDGGRTLSPPAVWTYDDGTSFYSPASYHRMIRHSVTGKLYWLGNISAEPPVGNSPRYPLVIAEVDETSASLKRDTVTAVDDRQPGQSSVSADFSNFSLLEGRETHTLELYLAHSAGSCHYTADSYKYTLTIVR